MTLARAEQEFANRASVATARARICVTLARAEQEEGNGASVAATRPRTCVTVARAEEEGANGASVAATRPRICVTVARAEQEGANGASVATSRTRFCERVAQKEVGMTWERPGRTLHFWRLTRWLARENDRQGPHGNRNPRRSPVPTHAGKIRRSGTPLTPMLYHRYTDNLF